MRISQGERGNILVMIQIWIHISESSIIFKGRHQLKPTVQVSDLLIIIPERRILSWEGFGRTDWNCESLLYFHTSVKSSDLALQSTRESLA